MAAQNNNQRPAPGGGGNQTKQQTGIPKSPSEVFRLVKNEAGNVVESAKGQVGGGGGLQEEVPPNEFDPQAHREKVRREEENKLKSLRKRLLQEIESQMAQASEERRKKMEEYRKQVEEQMRRVDEARGIPEEGQQIEGQPGEEFVPAAIKAKRGTGEAGKRTRKG